MSNVLLRPAVTAGSAGLVGDAPTDSLQPLLTTHHCSLPCSALGTLSWSPSSVPLLRSAASPS